jgi:hypothetical protein
MAKGKSEHIISLGPRRGHVLAVSSIFALIGLGAVGGLLLQGRLSLHQHWQMLALVLVAPILPQLFFRERSLDVLDRSLKIGKRRVPLDEIEAVCLYARIHIVYSRGGDRRDRESRPRKRVRWHVEALRGLERPANTDSGPMRHCIERVLQLGSLDHTEAERARAGRKLAAWWRATDFERIALGRGGSSGLRLRAELLARHADVPLVDLSGESIAVDSPSELDTPLLERIRDGHVTPQPPGPAPPSVSDRGGGQILRLDWSPLRLHPHKARVLTSLVLTTAAGLAVAFGLPLLLPDSWAGNLRLGGLVLVGLVWLITLLRAAWIQIDPSEVRTCNRWIFNWKKGMPLGALEAVRASPLLSPRLELLGDARRIAIPLDRSSAVWFRRRLLAHLAELAEAGVRASRPQVPRIRQRGLHPFAAAAIGLTLGGLVFGSMIAFPPAEAVSSERPDTPGPAAISADESREDEKRALADRDEPRSRAIRPDGRGPAGGAPPASLPDAAAEPSAPVDGGMAAAPQPSAPADEADAGPAAMAGSAAQPGDATAVAGRGSGQPVSWRGLGAYAVRLARTHRVELELSRLGDRMRIRGRALESKRQRGAARCVSYRCPLVVRVHPARDMERAFSTRRVRIKRRISERHGRFELELSARKICARQPRYLAISIDGPGELGARVDGDRFVLATDEGLCRGHSDLSPPEE